MYSVLTEDILILSVDIQVRLFGPRILEKQRDTGTRLGTRFRRRPFCRVKQGNESSARRLQADKKLSNSETVTLASSTTLTAITAVHWVLEV